MNSDYIRDTWNIGIALRRWIGNRKIWSDNDALHDSITDQMFFVCFVHLRINRVINYVGVDIVPFFNPYGVIVRLIVSYLKIKSYFINIFIGLNFVWKKLCQILLLL